MTVNDWSERKWTLGLQRLPASDADGGQGDDDAVEYELICRYCGDDPQLGYGEVPAELQRIRGPYQVKAGIEVFIEHDRSHEPAVGEATPLLAGPPRDRAREPATVAGHIQSVTQCADDSVPSRA